MTKTLDFTRVSALTPEVDAAIEHAFSYQPWSEQQVEAGQHIRSALAHAAKMAYAPPGPYRSTALRKLFEARMDANAAITFKGEL